MRALIARIFRRKPKPDMAHIRMQLDGLTNDILTLAYRAQRIRERAGLKDDSE